MSRIGREKITVPANVTVTIADGNNVTVKGPLGTLTQTFSTLLSIKLEGNELSVERHSEDKTDRSLHGLTRALLNNMVVGVSEGYSKKLEVVGVGYKVAKSGNKLQLFVGYSLMPGGVPQEKYCIEETNGVTLEVNEKAVPITITVKGIDKQAVGQMAAVIRSKRPPEPYHGKGVKYADERIRRKAGKTGK